MATPINFKGTNISLNAPAGDEDRVDPLRAFTNKTVVVTRWQFSEEDLAEIARTGCIFVAQISGQTIHPTAVGDESFIRGLCLDYGGTFPRQI